MAKNSDDDFSLLNFASSIAELVLFPKRRLAYRNDFISSLRRRAMGISRLLVIDAGWI
jgi:hypothetical protein